MTSFRRSRGWLLSLAAAVLGLGPLAGQISAAEIPLGQAVQRGLENLQKAAAKYPVHRDCFSCHHQTLPLLALVTASGRGFAVDDKLLQAQAEFSRDSFDRYVELMKNGKGIGGGAMTVGYGVWA